MKKLLLAILIVCVFVLPVFAIEAPPIGDKEIIEFLEKVGVQVRIPVKQVYRALSFYKYEEGQKLSDEKYKDLSEDEKVWYDQGYIVVYLSLIHI